MNEYSKIVVLSRDGKSKGRYTGGSYNCQLEGCRGHRSGVRWEDGKITFPCSRGVNIISTNKHQIV